VRAAESIPTEATGALPGFAEVAVSGAAPTSGSGSHRGVLSYAIPDGWSTSLVPGQLVWVPLRKKVVLGVVVATGDEPPEFPTRPLHSPVVPPVIVPEARFGAARWLARETASSLFAAVALFLAPGITTRTTDTFTLAVPDFGVPSDLTPTQRRFVDLLRDRGEMTLDQARTATGRSLTSVIGRLEELGVIRRVIQVTQRAPAPPVERLVRLRDADRSLVARSAKQAAILDELVRLGRFRRDGESDLVPLAELRTGVEADGATLNAMRDKGIVELVELPRSAMPQPRPAPAPLLTDEQAQAWQAVEHALAARDSTPHLLFGVTGSGKTEIYLRGVAWCLRHGRSAIVLVPEIGLTTQVVRRFVDRFPGQVVVLHSAMGAGRRHEVWRGIAAGEHRVVVGPRSALFAPVKDLGLIVLDEEHESTYKQESEPRYSAPMLARYLAREAGATLVMGSATPSIESSWRADVGTYRRLALPGRVNPAGSSAGSASATSGMALPEVEIVDLRLELQRGNTGLLSEALRQSVETTLRRREQAILLLNRRGTSTVVLCRTCGHRIICPNCDIPLVYHRDRQQMICHRCDHREVPARACPECSGQLDYFGAGTQRVEEEVRRIYPGARVLRWDQDAVRQQGGYDAMLGRVERQEVDIIVGTQMVAKGFDLPKVTAIGVVQADTLLYLPDFRSPERTFQLLTQVAGRAGRRAPGSTVVVQTYTPEHYAIVAASRHDYAAFYEEEIDFREQHGFPPFTRLVRYLYRHEKETAAALESEMMARAVAREARLLGVEIDILGPTPAFAARVRGAYQWQIVLRAHDLDPLLDDLPIRPGWVVDVDPQSML